MHSLEMERENAPDAAVLLALVLGLIVFAEESEREARERPLAFCTAGSKQPASAPPA